MGHERRLRAAGRAVRWRRSGPTDAGFTLVEVLAGLLLFGLLVPAAGTTVGYALGLSRAAEDRVAAVHVAAAQLELARQTPPRQLVDTGTVVQQVALGDVQYHVTRRIEPLDQPALGGGACGVDPGRVVALRIHVEVTWPDRPGRIPSVRQSTIKDVESEESLSGTGHLAVTVADAAGAPVAGAAVTVAPASLTTTTDGQGCATFLALPPRTDYAVTVSKAGHADPAGNPAPTRYYTVVRADSTAAVSFVYSPDSTPPAPLPPGSLQAVPTCPTASPVSFRSATTAATNGATSLTIAKPSGVLTGDVLLAQIAYRRDTSSAITAPAGWGLVRVDTHAGQLFTQAVYSKVATAGEPMSYTWSLALSDAATGALLAYSGVDTTKPINATASQANTSSTTITAPGVTTTAKWALVVTFYGARSNGLVTPPTSQTVRSRTVTTTNPASANTTIAAAEEVHSTAGSTGARAAALSTSGYNAGASVALTPAPPKSVPVQLTWTASPSATVTGYRLRRSSGGVVLAETPITGRDTTTATDGPVTAGTSYTYELAATDGTGWSTPVTTTLTPSC